MTAGLVTASAAVITEASAPSLVLAAVAGGCAVVLTKTSVHPLFVLGAEALIGLSGLGQM